ncbi:MAG: putative sulfate exporter family transporter, partial [Proteobacteria bacterium]|nr:putative sulfate exporter family transporter [Pseudomonadota bacterium]
MSTRPSWLRSEDWMSLCLGLFIFALSTGAWFGVDLLGWAAKTSVWVELGQAVAPVSKGALGTPASILLTFSFFLGLLTLAGWGLGAKLARFVPAFVAIYVVSSLCWLAGHYAYIAATPDKLAGLGIPWSLNLTGEAGYILALLAGLVVGNFFPRGSAALK